MKKKVLVDLEIRCDSPCRMWRGSLEYQEQQLECWAKDFNEFICDHRSQDPVYLSVQKIYEEQCEYCHREWEEESDGCPICCDRAVEEWKQSRVEVKEK